MRLCILFLVTLLLIACQRKKLDKENAVQKVLLPQFDTAGLALANEQRNSVQIERIPLQQWPMDSLIQAIETDAQVVSQHVGAAGQLTQQWLRYEELCRRSSKAQLSNLLLHKSPAVRCYAFDAIVHNYPDIAVDSLILHLHDTVMVSTLSGCLGWNEYVGDYMYNSLSRQLSISEKTVIDSMLIYGNNIILHAKDQALLNIKPLPRHYNRIKELATQNNGNAIIALARYQKQSDKSLIAQFFKLPKKSKLQKTTKAPVFDSTSFDPQKPKAISFQINQDLRYYAAEAVIHFPDPYFYPYLTDLCEQEWNRKDGKTDVSLIHACCQALVQFPSEQTIDLFKKSLTIKNQDKYEAYSIGILIAIRKFPHTIFEPLKKGIKLDEYGMEQVEWALKENNN